MSKITGLPHTPQDFAATGKKTLPTSEGDAFSLLLAALTPPYTGGLPPDLVPPTSIQASGLPLPGASQPPNGGMIPPVASRLVPSSASMTVLAEPMAIATSAPDAHVMSTSASDLAAEIIEAVIFPEGGIASDYLSELPDPTGGLHPGDVAAKAPLPPSAAAAPQVIAESAIDPAQPRLSATGTLSPARSWIEHASPTEPVGERERAEDTAVTHYPAAPMPFPERNFHVVVQSGEYQLWLRDYRLGETEKRTLIHRLLQALHGAGRHVTSISINGQRLWSAPTPISTSRT